MIDVVIAKDKIVYQSYTVQPLVHLPIGAASTSRNTLYAEGGKAQTYLSLG